MSNIVNQLMEASLVNDILGVMIFETNCLFTVVSPF